MTILLYNYNDTHIYIYIYTYVYIYLYISTLARLEKRSCAANRSVSVTAVPLNSASLLNPPHHQTIRSGPFTLKGAFLRQN